MAKRMNRVPLHRQVADLLRKRIETRCTAGERLPSESRLAAEHNVSVLTLREALSALAQEGLVTRRHGSGTYVSEPQRKVVGVLVEIDIADPRTSPFYLRVAQHMQARFRDEGYPVRLYAGHIPPDNVEPTGLTATELLDDLQRNRLAGVICVCPPGDESWVEALDKASVPLVCTCPNYRYQVSHPVEELIDIGIAYLAEAGRQRIAVAGWMNPGHAAEGGWASRCAAKIREAGLEVRPEWLRFDLHPASQGAGWEQMRDIWTTRDEHPDGLLVTDDLLFADAAMAILELDIAVPEELLVITHANRGLTANPPFPVARIEADPDLIASRAESMMLRLLSGQPVDEPAVSIPLELVEYESAEDEAEGAAEQRSFEAKQ